MQQALNKLRTSHTVGKRNVVSQLTKTGNSFSLFKQQNLLSSSSSFSKIASLTATNAPLRSFTLSRKVLKPLNSSSFPLSSSSSSISPFSSSFISIEGKRGYATPAEGELATEKMRNVAIIAHVDHGKTTLVDELLKQAGIGAEAERAMDSNDLEKERGITIIAKNTSMMWKDYKINLVDTPGHGDFGGEVERMMGLVDGVVLLVDAAEGVMTQTKFVLSKALKAGLKPIVVLNKMDRTERVRVDEVENEIFELFMSLGASEFQMEYPTLYASGRSGWATLQKNDPRENLAPLFDTIIKSVPKPVVPEEKRFAMSVTTIETDPFIGRIVTGRVKSGSVYMNMPIKSMTLEGNTVEEGRVTKLISRRGMERMIVNEAHVGDIVALAGLANATVTHTISDPTLTTPVATIPLDPPVLSMGFSVNNSPLAGQEGKQVTYQTIKKRLQKEIENNISISLREVGEMTEVCGRGELQLGVLIENLRREGMEFAVYPPRVEMRTTPEGEMLEPLEEVTIDVEEQYTGLIIDKLSNRLGEMVEMKDVAGKSRMVFSVPSRCLLGFRAEIMQETRGSAIFNHIFDKYVPYRGPYGGNRKGALISSASGTCTGYALETLEQRGTLFIKPGQKVYPGMIIGENSKSENLEVNPTKQKALSNVRSVSKEEQVRLTPPRVLTLEECMSCIRQDEALEVTPESFRLRKNPKSSKY